MRPRNENRNYLNNILLQRASCVMSFIVTLLSFILLLILRQNVNKLSRLALNSLCSPGYPWTFTSPLPQIFSLQSSWDYRPVIPNLCLYFICFAGAGYGTQGLINARKVLYHYIKSLALVFKMKLKKNKKWFIGIVKLSILTCSSLNDTLCLITWDLIDAWWGRKSKAYV